MATWVANASTTGSSHTSFIARWREEEDEGASGWWEVLGPGMSATTFEEEATS